MASVDPIIQQESLLAATGYERPGDLERWLRKHDIPYHRGKGNRIFTTLDALNGKLQDPEPDEIEFE